MSRIQQNNPAMLNNKLIRIVLAIVVLCLVFLACAAYRNHRLEQFEAYAEANDCSWVPNEYLGLDPICVPNSERSAR